MAVSLLYLQVTTVGVIYSWALFRHFGVNVFDYAETNDFLLAAFKNMTVFTMSTFTVLITIVYLLLFGRAYLRRGAQSEDASPQHFLERLLRSFLVSPLRSEGRMLAVLFTFFIMYTLFFPFALANAAAESLLQGPPEGPLTSVQYRATSGTEEQTRVTGLRVIGTTQNFSFFYDKEPTPRTLIIPHAQIVEIEYDLEGEPTTSAQE
jgi:hypothetical protein